MSESSVMVTVEPTPSQQLPQQPADADKKKASSKSRLWTPEFLVWCAVVAVAYAGTFYACRGLTLRAAGRSRRFTREGWLPGGHRVDASDHQWRQLRPLLPALYTGCALWAAASAVVRRRFGAASRVRAAFYAASALALLYGLHARAALLAIAVAALNFAIARGCRGCRVVAPALAWAFNVGVTLWMYVTAGGGTVPALAWFHGRTQVLRWHVIFKIPLLRCLSFSMDYYWALRNKPPTASIAKHSELERLQEENRPIEQYDFLTYFIYVFYPPLYFAGPVVTFNAFAAQLREPQKTVPLRKAIRGLVFVAIYIFGFDVANHLFHINGINETKWWTQDTTPLEICAMSLYVVNWMWMKFLIIWRFFRLFSVIDGIDTHENMPRCISMISHPSVLWRSWHASFNQWTVRYIYIPLGGRRFQWATAWLIFFYVAMWHDIDIRWLAWGVFNCAALFLEVGIRGWTRKTPRLARARESWYWRHVEAFGSVLSIIMLIAANLSVSHGFDYTPVLVRRFLFQPDSWKAVLVVVVSCFAGAHVQKEIRAEEARRTGHSKRF